MIWDGTRLVAGGYFLATSPEGDAWVFRQQDKFHPTAMAWTGSQYVGVGYNGTIATSLNAADWADRSSGTRKSLSTVAWAGSRFIAAGESSAVLTSPDGIAWTPQDIPVASDPSGVKPHIYSLAWTGSRVRAVCGNGAIYSSQNGSEWRLDSSGTNARLLDIVWTGSLLVAVGFDGTILSSPDGKTWEKKVVGTTDLITVAWNGRLLVAMGQGPAFFTSPDGVTWRQPESGTAQEIFSIAGNGKALVAVGRYGSILSATSDPGSISPPRRSRGEFVLHRKSDRLFLTNAVRGTAAIYAPSGRRIILRRDFGAGGSIGIGALPAGPYLFELNAGKERFVQSFQLP